MEKKRKLSEDAGENGKRFCYENHITIEYLTKENDKIAILSMNRPETRNALSIDLVNRMMTALEQVVEEGRDVRCLVIRSMVTGVFSAGADLKERIEMSNKTVMTFLTGLKQLIATLETLPIPVIAAVDGPALGGGLELILGCDVRIATTRAWFGLPETRLGVLPGAGGTVRLGHIIGWARARDMVLTGRRIDGEMAEQWGLVTRCVDGVTNTVMDTALSVARDIAKAAPVALNMAKLSVQAAQILPQKEALSFETICYESLLNTWDRREGLTAWSQRRAPVFRGK